MKRLVVSLHDVHPGSFSQIQEQVQFCSELGVTRFSFLVVPDFHHQGILKKDSSIVEWLQERQALGDEMVLHGFYHQRGRDVALNSFFWTQIYTQNEAEFYDLTKEEATERLRFGKNLFSQIQLFPNGFIAPGWLLGQEALKSVFSEGFDYTTTLKAVCSKNGRQTFSQSLCYSTRARWRRIVSLAWNQMLWQKVSKGNLIRLSLHPNDLSYASLRRQIANLIQKTLDMGFQAVTYRDLVRKLVT